MVTIKNTQRTSPLNTTKIKKQAQAMLAAAGYSDFDLSIWFTTNATIRTYNKRYRGKDKPTDILSFPFHDLKPGQKIHASTPEEQNLGDIIISVAYAAKDCHPTWHRTLDQHLTHLIAHGIAHLLGHDHETDKDFALMQKFEQKILKALYA